MPTATPTVSPTATPTPTPLAVPSMMRLGVNLTQHSADAWNPPSAVASADAVVRGATTFQGVSLMGWGTLNPEPSPGVYDWSILDTRLQKVVSTGGTPVIILCGAPDWMKGGSPGDTDWSQLEVAPLPSHYQDFANLAVAVARRYPFVHYFEVWNEFKGFYDPVANNWDIEAYTDLYNTVADALTAYDPTLQIGGPYAPVDIWADPTAGGHPSSIVGLWGTVDERALDAISYWLKNAHHPSFVCVDGSLLTKDAATQTDSFGAAAYFAAVDEWIRSQTQLPIWWSEWYASTTTVGPTTSQEWVALSTVSLFQLSVSGASVVNMWDPEQYTGSTTPGLWTSTVNSTGGQPTPLAPVFESLTSNFAPGTRQTLAGPDNGVMALVSDANYIAVNTTGQPQTASIGGVALVLGPYHIAIGKIATSSGASTAAR
jgi:Glycosyl hydrolases family 39